MSITTGGKQRKKFTYEEAVALLPRVQDLTQQAVARIELLLQIDPADDDAPVPDENLPEYEAIVSEWAESVIALGVEVKGLWLVDFDSGSGYYCWRHPEPALQFFHGYEEGFRGRIRLN
jgi:hypothetical protein